MDTLVVQLTIIAAPVTNTQTPNHILVGGFASNGYRLEGKGYIAGDTAIDGDPADPDVPDVAVVSLVRLYRDSDGRLVGSRTSDATTGAWRFSNINEEYTYTAIAYYAGYRAVVADGVRPAVTP